MVTKSFAQPHITILDIPGGYTHGNMTIAQNQFDYINPAITDKNFASKSVPMQAGESIMAILHCAEQYREIKNDPTFKRVNYGIYGLLLFWTEGGKHIIPNTCAGIITYGTEPWIDSCGAIREPCIKLPRESIEDEKSRTKTELVLWHANQTIPEHYWVLSFLK